MKVFIDVLIVISISIVCYLIFAFIGWELNPGKWHPMGRVMLPFPVVLLSLFAIGSKRVMM